MNLRISPRSPGAKAGVVSTSIDAANDANASFQASSGSYTTTGRQFFARRSTVPGRSHQVFLDSGLVPAGRLRGSLPRRPSRSIETAWGSHFVRRDRLQDGFDDEEGGRGCANLDPEQ